VRTILVEAWDKDPQKRPSMKRIGTLVRADLQDISEDDNVVNRTEHMMNRSKRSFRLNTGSSLKSSHDVKNCSPMGGASNHMMLEEANAVRLESEQKTGTVAEVGEVVRNRKERS
jgi:hypothetical protein